ncbi:MAG TPA: RNA polymerase sigma factor FliA [Pusillimonas sp.]|uniref:RNA polymerase sigma factor FliA n=1 Tax=Pusillimonas sp. TaxID=3040095 RepID=UPI002BC536F8|nr:RNA polymerase sigma factor FliA [Pusillimonas sp.]HUH88917.1 RNA polymerase sigma factor FliA [Pusillimonas sp.]
MLSSEDLLVRQYTPLVRRVALQLVARLPANVELDDLMQAGLMGLLDAARRYREMADAQFETYATTRIRGAMLDELRSQDWLPRSVRSKSRRIETAIHELTHRLLRAPSEAEIADELEMPLESYQEMLEEARGVQILHYEDLARNQNDAGADLTADPELSAWDNPLDRLVSKGLRSALVEAIKALPEREQLLLSLQFEQDLNQKEISLAMGVTEGRVSQLRTQAVGRIRAYLAASAWNVEPSEGYADSKLI